MRRCGTSTRNIEKGWVVIEGWVLRLVWVVLLFDDRTSWSKML
jgi:hypothetical protein